MNRFVLIQTFFLSFVLTNVAPAITTISPSDVRSDSAVLCPHSEVCSCTEEKIECVCKEGYDKLDFLENNPGVECSGDEKSLSIQMCSTVVLPDNCLTWFTANMTIRDVGELRINNFPAVSLKNLIIENVENVSVFNERFLELQLMKIQNSNIHLMNISTLGIDDVIISSCVFDMLCMNILGGHTFHMINTTVHGICHDGIYFGTYSDIRFQSTNFSITKVDSPEQARIPFRTFSVSNWTIYNCKFEAPLDFKFDFWGDIVSRFHFENNTVTYLGAGTFDSLRVEGSIIFANNRIFTAEPQSFAFAEINLSRQIDFRNNFIGCSCDFINFVWQRNYDILSILNKVTIIDNSKCLAPKFLEGASLSCLFPYESYFISRFATKCFSDSSYGVTREMMAKFYKQHCNEFAKPTTEGI